MYVATTSDEGRQGLSLLVEKFERHRSYYKSSQYTEAATRTDFIDQLLGLLGWDVDDDSGLGRRRDVLVENKISQIVDLAGTAEWDDDLSEAEIAERNAAPTFPDYLLRVDAQPRIVVEAKKPSVNLAMKGPSFQAKSYAWSMRLPVAILTDFEELRVFDSRFRPAYERPNGGLFPGLNLSYTRYGENWEAIWHLLSRESVVGGSIDHIAQKATPRGAQPVDRAFLEELGQWRLIIAKDLKANNPDLTSWELAEATQRVLDRVIFIRSLEDRGLVDGFVLRRYARRADAYRHVLSEFRRLDAAYNGLLLSEHFSERLHLSDSVFQKLIEQLYYPYSPYRFDAVPVDLLGSIYEQFLGSEVTVTATGDVALTDKPEVRHAGGVYYTPKWIVDRVVQSILDPLVAGKKPSSVSNLRIIDPACGSGAFLLGAFEYLVGWHESYYADHPSENQSAHFATASGERRLTSDAKAQILANNLYGVDLDPQAVEVTQMSLYLAMLSGESKASLDAQTRLFHLAYLPRLDKNVRCGNSLIETVDVPNRIFDSESLLRRVNPFDWRDERHGFGPVFRDRGGFDAVIGNPPYTRIQVLRRYRAEEADIYRRKFTVASTGSFDVSNLFVERALELLRNAGRFGFITSRQFCETDSGRPLRRLLADGRHTWEIVDFVDGLVFEGVGAYTLLLFGAKKPSSMYRITRVPRPPTKESLLDAELSRLLSATKPAGSLKDDEWTLDLPSEEFLMNRLSTENDSLIEYCDGVVFQGVVTGSDYVFKLLDGGHDIQNAACRQVMRRDDGRLGVIEDDLLRPVYAGGTDIKRFLAKDPHEVLLFPYVWNGDEHRYRLLTRQELESTYANAWEWLCTHRDKLEARAGNWTDDNWWAYSRRQNLERFGEPKILVPYMVDELCCYRDPGNGYLVNVSTGGYGIPFATVPDPEYLEALLNSRLLSWTLRRYSRAFRGGYFAARKGNLARLPIHIAVGGERQAVVDAYQRCRSTCEALDTTRGEHAKALAVRSHRHAVRMFDRIVENLYGVTAVERELLDTLPQPTEPVLDTPGELRAGGFGA